MPQEDVRQSDSTEASESASPTYSHLILSTLLSELAAPDGPDTSRIETVLEVACLARNVFGADLLSNDAESEGGRGDRIANEPAAWLLLSYFVRALDRFAQDFEAEGRPTKTHTRRALLASALGLEGVPGRKHRPAEKRLQDAECFLHAFCDRYIAGLHAIEAGTPVPDKIEGQRNIDAKVRYDYAVRPLRLFVVRKHGELVERRLTREATGYATRAAFRYRYGREYDKDASEADRDAMKELRKIIREMGFDRHEEG